MFKSWKHGCRWWERALSHDAPHSQATSQWPLGVPGPGAGTTGPLSPSAGPGGLCKEEGTPAPFPSQPSPHFPPKEAGFVGPKLCSLPGFQTCEVSQTPSEGLWWGHSLISQSTSPHCSLEVVACTQPQGHVQVKGPGTWAGKVHRSPTPQGLVCSPCRGPCSLGEDKTPK